jgi:hypothetical protein
MIQARGLVEDPMSRRAARAPSASSSKALATISMASCSASLPGGVLGRKVEVALEVHHRVRGETEWR